MADTDYTCKDCANYTNCSLAQEKINFATKVEELISNEFKCFKRK